MKTLVTALASVALLAAPMAASAHGFGGGGGGHGGGFAGGGHGGFGGGFGGHAAAAAPAFHGGGMARADLGGRGFEGRGYAGRGYGGPAYRGGGFRGYGHGYGYGGVGYRWAVGAVLPALYWDAYLNDPFDYGLEAAPVGCHWVEADGQALLIDDATGAVIQAAPL